MTRGIDLAQNGVLAGDLAPYLAFERSTFRMVGIFGCIGYLLAAIGWTRCFALAGTWSRTLTWLSIAAWGTFAAAILVYFLPERIAPGPSWVSFANAVGFVLLQAWLILVTERVAGRCRPAEAHGRYAAWHHPGHPMIARMIDAVARSHFARALGEWLPPPTLVSDIRDVVYVNYLVDAERLEPLVPEGLRLQRLGPQRQYALFTFLTYRHGHFGPALLGRFRRHLPSPIQSNWRIHVTDPVTRQRGVYFLSTAISSTPHALAGPTVVRGRAHACDASADLVRDASGRFTWAWSRASDSDPTHGRRSVRASSKRSRRNGSTASATGRDSWSIACRRTARCVASRGTGGWRGRRSSWEFRSRAASAMDGKVESRAVAAIAGDTKPLCFYVPSVTFRFTREVYDLPSAPQRRRRSYDAAVDEELRHAVTTARERQDVLEALRGLYADVQQEIDRRRPVCVVSGPVLPVRGVRPPAVRNHRRTGRVRPRAERTRARGARPCRGRLGRHRLPVPVQ